MNSKPDNQQCEYGAEITRLKGELESFQQELYELDRQIAHFARLSQENAGHHSYWKDRCLTAEKRISDMMSAPD